MSITVQLESRKRPAKQTALVVRGGADYKSEQGSDYQPGVSAETAGSKAVFLGVVTLQAGARTRAHVHEQHETALYLLSGSCELWTDTALFVNRSDGCRRANSLKCRLSECELNRSVQQLSRI